MLDARPTAYKTVWERRTECERHMKQLRAVQRAHQHVGNAASAEAAGQRLNVLLHIWEQLNAQCG